MSDSSMHDVVTKVRDFMIPIAFPALGLEPVFTPVSLDRVEERINEQYPQGHEPLVTTLYPFAIHLGEVLVRNLDGAHWNTDCEDIWGISVRVPSPRGEFVVFPFVRVKKFWFDRTDGLGVMYRMLNAINLGLLDPTKKADGQWTNVHHAGGTDSYRFFTAEVPK